MSKKILSVVLALVFVLTTFAVSAFAVGASGYEEDAAAYTQTWALGEPVDNGDGTWTVDVSLTANYYVGAISFVVTNTAPTNAVLTSVTKGAALTYEANIQKNATTGLVAIIPEPLTDADLGADLTAGGVIAQLTYTLAGGASADLAIENAPKTATNPGGELIAVRLSDNNLTTGKMIYGQTVTSVGETRTLGAVSAPADLAKKAGAEAGVLIDKGHTFGGAYTGVVFGFTQAANNTFTKIDYLKNNLEATNGGSLAFSRSIGKTGYGTGTVITVKNADGTVAATYVVVIFGDADGNGYINGNDTKAVKAAVNVASTYANNSVQRMAANCQLVNMASMMHTLNGNDTKALKAHVNGKKLDQAALAAKQAGFTVNYL